MKNELLYICSTQIKNDKIESESNLFDYYKSNNQINFISKDKTNPNITVSDRIHTGFWYTDTKFIYSIKKEGIFLYDLESKNRIILQEGKEEYTFEKYEDGILFYDEGKTMQISD